MNLESTPVREEPNLAAPLAPASIKGWGRPTLLLVLVSLPLLIALLGVAAFSRLSRYFWFGPG